LAFIVFNITHEGTENTKDTKFYNNFYDLFVVFVILCAFVRVKKGKLKEEYLPQTARTCCIKLFTVRVGS
jgi:hypothetical protein